MLRTNSKKYLNNIQNYILDSIDGEGYDIKTETPTEKLEFLFDCFEVEFNYKNNKLRYPNFQDRFANWLQGSPSAIDLPYQNYKILQLSKNLLEVDTLSEKLENQIIKNYWSFMAYHIIKLKKQMKETINTILDIEYKLENLYPNETIETQLKHLQKDIKRIYKNLDK